MLSSAFVLWRYRPSFLHVWSVSVVTSVCDASVVLVANVGFGLLDLPLFLNQFVSRCLCFLSLSTSSELFFRAS